MDLVNKFQKDPQLVDVAGDQITVPQVEQSFFEVKPWMKLDMLCSLIDTYNPAASLVFCNTKRRVDEIVKSWRTRGYSADCLHGDMTQSGRDRAMMRFRKKQASILVATDVAARGIDVDGIEAVINYDVPQDDQHYVHRIGRTGRLNKKGKAISLVTEQEEKYLLAIQNYIGQEIPLRERPPKETLRLAEAEFKEKNDTLPEYKVRKGEELSKETGVSTEDIERRIADYGIQHYFTSHHPWLIPEPMTVEPCETYSQDDLDEYYEVLKTIAQEARENPELVISSPHKAASHKRANPAELDDPKKWAMTWRAYLKKK
jgi:superfamily II DNA/RNA helicase